MTILNSVRSGPVVPIPTRRRPAFFYNLVAGCHDPFPRMPETMPKISHAFSPAPEDRPRGGQSVRSSIRLVLTLLVAGVLAAIAEPAAAQLGSAVASKSRGAAQLGAPCGQCTGDLNGDGQLNELDIMVFDLYEAGFPQNPCADFTANPTGLPGWPPPDGVVDEWDKLFLTTTINASDGSCIDVCGAGDRGCLVEAVPGDASMTGCDDAVCCSVVCEIDPQCCSVIWDAGCVTIAQNLCVPENPDTRPDAGDCLCEHSFAAPAPDCVKVHGYAGCADVRCSALVCAVDPACCQGAWDADCVAIAKAQCQDACSNALLRDSVCELRPECCGYWTVDPATGNEVYVTDWDSSCTELAALIIINEPGLQIRYFPSNGLLCDPVNEEARPLDIQLDDVLALFCIMNPAYCTPSGQTAFTNGVAQCITRLEANYPGCAELFAAGEWDAGCAQIADQLCRWPDPLEVGLGDCLRVHDGGGCSDGFCTSQVCEIDPACCDSDWDLACVRLAAARCVLVPSPATGRPDVRAVGATAVRDDVDFGCGSKAAGACCYANFSPYCDDAACCQLVCSYDEYCCNARWDEYCAQLATDGCAILAERCTCGPKDVAFPPFSRSCFDARPTNAQWQTGCDDSLCCNAVCLIDPFCCEVRWDSICAEGAGQVCSSICDDQPGGPICLACTDPLAGSCYAKHLTPGCEDERCCQTVCEVDLVCCTVEWDGSCIELAEELCTECGDIYAGSCLSPHAGPACADAACCVAICAVDPYCCNTRWDGSCASQAANSDTCVSASACGSANARDCYIASITPGCSDAACCERICSEFDSWCCEVRWDAICATQAFAFCNPPQAGGTRLPCDVRHTTPGCNDPQCASAICSIAGFEYCCLNRWDTNCVQAAEALCIGLYVCPGPGDCEKAHATPLCDDPSCCNAVCAYDPACCRIEWDAGCATLAITTCRVPIESSSYWSCPCEGSCFTARTEEDPSPGCNDASCCAVVCRIDETCCTENWDETCVDLASFYCGAEPICGAPAAGSCLDVSETPFCDDAECCSAVCAIDTVCCTDRWDSFCVSLAQDRCRRGCGVESAGSCFFPHLSPGCEDMTCCLAVCEADIFCCNTIWDGTCAEMAIGDPGANPPVPGLCDVPECGEFAAGDCCEISLSPSCNDKRCCNSVCETDSFCCDVTWDIECVRLARQDDRCGCGANWDCGEPCSGDCCVPNFTPKCNDEACCTAVCDIDSYCCDVEWDVVCASGALQTEGCTGPDEACPVPQCGDADAGDCCYANGTPSCSDETCCDAICLDDPACCDIAWDSICAASAAVECDVCTSGLECGSPDAGDCTVANDTPYCDDEGCCNFVCQIEFFCCVGNWDEYCAALAESVCPSP
jgi:hypothetical protein